MINNNFIQKQNFIGGNIISHTLMNFIKLDRVSE